jgi:hypothetical protein
VLSAGRNKFLPLPAALLIGTIASVCKVVEAGGIAICRQYGLARGVIAAHFASVQYQTTSSPATIYLCANIASDYLGSMIHETVLILCTTAPCIKGTVGDRSPTSSYCARRSIESCQTMLFF